jgi:hypothetical protein
MWEKESRGAEVLFRRLCNTRNPLDYDSLGRSGLALNDRVSTCTILSAAEDEPREASRNDSNRAQRATGATGREGGDGEMGAAESYDHLPTMPHQGRRAHEMGDAEGWGFGWKGNCGNLDGRDLSTATRALPMARGDWGALRQLHLNVEVLTEQATIPRKAAWQPIRRVVNSGWAAIRENWSQRLSQC